MLVKQSLSHRLFQGSKFSLALPLEPDMGLRDELAGYWPSATQSGGAIKEAPRSQAWSTVKQQTEHPVSWQLF